MSPRDDGRRTTRRRVITALALAPLMPAAHPLAGAEYPSRPVTIIVPYPPGGSSDVQTRVLAKGLSARLGQPVVVDNRAGAGGRIGVAVAARAAPDGYTLVFASLSTFVVEPALRTEISYDPLRDFTPLSLMAEMPFVLVVAATSPAKSLPDLVARARSQPAGLTYASWGVGSAGHLLGETLKQAAGFEAVHVPYKGEAPALLDLIGGQVSMMFVTAVGGMSQIQAGKLRALAVTGAKRASGLPDVPTFAEAQVKGLDLQFWSGLAVPARTPPDVTERLAVEVRAVLKSAEFAQFARSQGAVPAPGTGKEMTERIRADTLAIRQIVRTMDLKLED